VSESFNSKCLTQRKVESKKARLNQSQKVVRPPLDPSEIDESSVISLDESLKKSVSSRKGVIFSNLWRFVKNKNEVPQTASSSGSSVRRVGTGTMNLTNFRSIRRRLTIKPNDPDFIKIFKKISGDKAKISNEDLKAYLNTRYPSLMVDVMMKFFSFKYTSFDDYVNEMNRFVSLGEERHLNFCFEVFDLNKDRRISYQDLFKAIEIRTGNHYDEDLILILDMFDIKAAGSLKTKGNKMLRRRSTFSLIKDDKKVKDLKDEEIRPAEVKVKQVAINYTEFCMIKFNVRPQIMQDFLKFTCNYDFVSEKGLALPLQPSHLAKDSESIVVDMNLNPDSIEKLMKSDKYEYYCALDAAMALFNKAQLEDLLKKFRFLQSEDRLRLKVISKQSMIEKLVLNK
jgi:Ca2+-binding EF-hand superfamily protein